MRIGVVGCGGTGLSHLRALLKKKKTDNLEIVSVCDVYRKRLERAVGLTGAATYPDYRKLLENKNVDYVLIPTPEHWHAPIVLEAAQAGKHIYPGEPLKCDCRLGYYGVVACHLGRRSFRRQRQVRWDRAKEKLIDA